MKSNFSLIYTSPYCPIQAQTIRSKYLTNKHTISEKMELYNASCYGNYNDLVNLDKKGYSLFEECSKSGYFWTAYHYVSHFGQEKLLDYLLSKKYPPEINRLEAFNMQTMEGYTSHQESHQFTAPLLAETLL